MKWAAVSAAKTWKMTRKEGKGTKQVCCGRRELHCSQNGNLSTSQRDGPSEAPENRGPPRFARELGSEVVELRAQHVQCEVTTYANPSHYFFIKQFFDHPATVRVRNRPQQWGPGYCAPQIPQSRTLPQEEKRSSCPSRGTRQLCIQETQARWPTRLIQIRSFMKVFLV